MIKITNARKLYTDQVTIGPLNIEIPKAGFTSLIGPNGAGKSTTLMMIGRLLELDEGQISVANMDVSASKSKDLAKIITILRQENHFVTRLTVRQLAGFGRFPYSKGRLTKEDEAIISKYIDFLDLTDLENRYLDELSGGQRQRAYVAMVLCQETEYVLLDEPLNNLDIARSVQMMEHLRQAANEFGRTILTVMHDINFAAKYSDRICAMKDGQIAAFGTVAEIMRPEVLTAIFDTKIEILEGPYGPIAVY
ncbi:MULTISPECIES: ATP-binding cassette domain-containing protein [unclassified Paenibacillus]|uniref:iron ABC transporter ATP-binding protein n=1 Tax=unclassified Paenibacillus TaxID=185978 RepID=UPI00240724EF|nr:MULTISPECIES: ATP-binding cassette domain-containing protein [unclassified Paenibacillus]MDF9843763.1 iron complex transport system ATP-binding protein [Paenibacillus sp. PastF-2]MDF9850398.1 iron complex transport system ATP-binding protein [Paenibacillus sp. PastM-2]MDF9856899.1 iron complex transport system ATP-binding protein [Paenibacillus sp. PastF-1]MDH6482244.1 iron complex transport system ATP-binding protein [Paenibacillus sp. PastH-2]MDH6509592.1 iron complex transport system ATP